MPIRSLCLVLFGVMTFACAQKLAPEAAPPDTTQGAATTGDAGAPARADDTKPAEPPPSAPDAGKTNEKTDNAQPAADPKKKTDDPNTDVGDCFTQCRDPECFTKCVDDFNPGAFGFGG